jgi:hypothetical protein
MNISFENGFQKMPQDISILNCGLLCSQLQPALHELNGEKPVSEIRLSGKKHGEKDNVV